MDQLAKKILKELVKPTLEKACEADRIISERELHAIGQLTDIAKDLIECDMMLERLDEARSNPKPHDMVK